MSASATFEAFSKYAALVSVALILVLQVALHPAMTTGVRLLVVLAFGAGWHGGARAAAFFAFIAPLAPALLAQVAGFSDPVHHTVWLAGLAGAALHATNRFTWDLPGGWRVLLGGWALTLALAWPVLVAREVGFDPRGVFDTGTVNSWAFLAAPQVVGWILHVVLVQLVGLLWLEWLMRRTAVPSPSPPLTREGHALWIGATAGSMVAIYQGIVDAGFLTTAQWASLGRVTGLMLDANGYGVVAALAGPFAVVAIAALRLRHGALLAAAALGVNWAGLWMSGSRTALACGAIAAAALAIGLLRGRNAPVAVFIGLACALAAAAAMIALLSTATGPWQRLQELAGRSAPQTAQALWDRGGYGDIATRMIRTYPLAGVGVGTYHWLAPDYWRLTANDRLPFDNAQNWWRHQVAELGVLGSLPLLAWGVVLAWTLLRPGGARDRAAEGVTLRGLLLGLAVISLVGMPTENPVVLIWFFYLVARLVATLDRERVLTIGWQPGPAAWLAVATLAIAYAAGQAMLARGPLHVVQRALDADRDYISGVYAPEELPGGVAFRWTRQDARFMLVTRTPWMLVRGWLAHPDLAEHPVDVRLATPCEVVWERTIDSPERFTVAIRLPPGQGRVTLSTHVSRTWNPSHWGSDDRRVLGAALIVSFIESEAGITDVRPLVDLQPCEPKR